MICDDNQERLQTHHFAVSHSANDFGWRLVRSHGGRLAICANGFGKECRSAWLDLEERNSGLVFAREVSKVARATACDPRIHCIPAKPNLVDQRIGAGVDRIAIEGPYGPAELGGSTVDCYTLKPCDLESKDLNSYEKKYSKRKC